MRISRTITFSGLVPDMSSLVWYFNASGNPYLCGPHLRPCGSAYIKLRILLPLVSLGILFFCSLVVVLGVLIIHKRAVRKQGDGGSWKMTTYQELNFGCDDVLKCITEENVIGKGAAGVVYKGFLTDGEQIAIKKVIAPGTCNGSSNDHGFSTEVETWGKIRHRHIVRLLAFCSNHDTNLLVYRL